MSVDNLDVMDLLGTDASGDLLLTISDHLDWDDSVQHQLTLQAKINKYLAFIESGEILEHRPEAAANRVVIRVLFKFWPDPEALRFLTRAKACIEEAGFGFEFAVLVVPPSGPALPEA